MLVDVKFASWEDSKKAFFDFEKRIAFDTKNLDRLIILESLEDSDCEYDSSHIILDLLDKILGGCWLDVIGKTRKTTRPNIALLTEYHENKRN